MLRYTTDRARPGLVALYDFRPGNGAGQFLQPRSLHGAVISENIGRLNRRQRRKFCAMKYVHAAQRQILVKQQHNNNHHVTAMTSQVSQYEHIKQ